MTISERLDETELLPHILRETTGRRPRGLWLSLNTGEGCREWERILAVSREPLALGSLQVIPAAIDTVREQAAASWWSTLLSRGRQADAGDTVFIPNDTTGQRIKPKRRDAVLVVADDPAELNAESLRAHWPAAERFEQLGRDLWLVVGVPVSRDGRVAGP